MGTSPKTKIFFLAPYPFGRVASQRFRFEQYWDVLEEHYKIEFQSFLSESSFNILYQKGRLLKKTAGVISGFLRRFFILFRLFRFDYIFIHREVTPVGPPVFELIIAKILRKRIIYDFDDAIWLSNTSGENMLAAFAKCHWKVKYICSWSVKITCGNDFLCDFAKKFNENVFYLPTTLDLDKISVLKNDSKSKTALKTIGWTGTHSTLKYLHSLVPILQDLQKHVVFRFVVIADKDPELPLENYEFKPWNKSTEWDDLATLDVGLMPLESTEWEEGKCGFKALQYMALGIPALASPTGVNKRIIASGVNGFICDSIEDWKKGILAVLNENALREQFSINGRKKIEEDYSKKAWAKMFVETLTTVKDLVSR